MRARTGFLVVFLALAVAGCGSDKKYSGPSIPVTYDSVPSYQQELITEDLKVLGGLPNGYGNTSVLEVSQFAGPSFNEWLGARVKYILGTNYDFDGKIPQPRESIFVKEGVSLGMIVRQVMFGSAYAGNLGAVLWNMTKKDGVTYTMNVAGQTVTADTPRVGVQVVTNLFFETDSIIEDSDPDSLANTLVRLAILFHEGRHGDGNGDNATFPHTDCTESYRKRVCDASTNGPNAVEAAFLTYALSVCEDCDNSETEGLRIFLADSLSRVRYDAKHNDPTPVTN